MEKEQAKGRNYFDILTKGDSQYRFFKAYCQENEIKFEDYTEEKIISTRTIPRLAVFNDDGDEVSTSNCCVSGDDNDFQIFIEGNQFPVY